jgi:hypothetical protein
VRPLPSAEVVLSSASTRYYAPLRLPTGPGAISAPPSTHPLSVPAPPAGPPVVPSGAVPACHPCYPGGPPGTGRRRWSLERRSSSPDNGVDALTEFTGLPLGSLHAIRLRRTELRAHLSERSSGNLVLPVTRGTHTVGPLPPATRARCPLPGPDFHRRVPEYPRHTVRYLFSERRSTLTRQVPVEMMGKVRVACSRFLAARSAQRIPQRGKRLPTIELCGFQAMTLDLLLTPKGARPTL